VHPIEVLYTLMGPGCVEVTRMFTKGGEVITGRWKDGRLGTVRTMKPYGDYGAAVFYEKKVGQSPANAKFSYVPLVRNIVKFFQTGDVPVPNGDSLEMFAFMDAALRSKQAGGRPMRLR
jgi:hypothetical protein